jgi:hypothetical protein
VLLQGKSYCSPEKQHHKEGEVMKKKSLAFVLAGIMLCLVVTPAFAKKSHKKHHHHHHSAQQAQR